MKKIKLSFIVDQLTELGWDYTCGRMSRSGMQIYDEIMRYVGALEDGNIGMKTYTQNLTATGN